MTQKPLKMICRYCGSDDVVRDACAEWCPETQQWVLRSVYDNADCNSCNSETKLEAIEMEAVQ